MLLEREKEKPFIIAEMSGNHNQSLERALAIVDAAAEAGVDAVKLQTYTADTMTLNIRKKEFMVKDAQSLWAGKSLYELYQEAHTPWEWHKPIFERCKEKGILGFSTPFDKTSLEFLETLNVPCYKIASLENTDLPLISKVAATKKTLLISSGTANVGELSEAVDVARKNGCKELILLKCTTSYPADPKDSNLRTIPHMKELFQCEVGLSDHTLGLGAAVASVALGAAVIEKHFTLSRGDGGVDAAFSLEPQEMKQLVVECHRAFQAMGTISYQRTKSEEKSLQFRRSLYVVEDVQAGEPVTEKNVRAIRPGLGLEPKYLELVRGARFSQSVSKGTALQWKYLLR